MTGFDSKRMPAAAATLGLLVCAAAAINALAFTADIAIAVPISDAWAFLESFVRPALEQRLRISDFFVQRAASDHAQPLQKLVMLADLHWTDLDFGRETLFGILVGTSACLWLSWSMVKGAATSRELGTAILGACVVFGVGLSLNATMIYTWYLVGLAWIPLLLAFVYWYTIGRPMSLRLLSVYAGAATFALGMVLDEPAIPAFVAAVIALAIRERFRNLKPALATLIPGAAGLALARWLLQLMAPTAGVSDATDSSVLALMGVLAQPDAWKLIVIPLTASLVHPLHLKAAFPDHSMLVQGLIAAALAAAHACFWWRAVAGRRRPRPQVLVLAVATMLFFYATIAGIAMSRIPGYGMDYVQQWRYVLFFQLNIIALALMFLSPQRTVAAQAPPPSTVPWAAPVGAVLVLALQFPLASAAWKSAPYIRNSARNMANVLEGIARDPQETPPAGCTPMLPICRFPVGAREATMTMLRQHRLNIFSPDFRARHGLDDTTPSAAHGPVMEPRASDTRRCEIQPLDWAPRTAGNAPFNVRPDGRSVYWLKVDPDAPDFSVEFAGHLIHTVRKGELVTFAHSETMQAAIASGRPLQFDLVCRGRKTGSFSVDVADR